MQVLDQRATSIFSQNIIFLIWKLVDVNKRNTHIWVEENLPIRLCKWCVFIVNVVGGVAIVNGSQYHQMITEFFGLN